MWEYKAVQTLMKTLMNGWFRLKTTRSKMKEGKTNCAILTNASQFFVACCSNKEYALVSMKFNWEALMFFVGITYKYFDINVENHHHKKSLFCYCAIIFSWSGRSVLLYWSIEKHRGRHTLPSTCALKWLNVSTKTYLHGLKSSPLIQAQQQTLHLFYHLHSTNSRYLG